MARRCGVNKLLMVVMATLVACRPAGPRVPIPAAELPQRLVLALDGVDFRDVEAARARGLFRDFRPPGRLVSTFPSISDIAWHAIFGIQPPAGYQRVYYSERQNAVLGDALAAIRPIEYELRMDAAFDTKFHHLGAYLMSGRVARGELDEAMRVVLGTRGRRTVYVYNVGPDALQHTRGNIDAYLGYLDHLLDSMQTRYRERTGRPLEIVVLSDHGHNRAVEASFLPLTEALQAHGFHAGRALRAANDIAFSVDGVTTGFGIFCHRDSAERVARLVAEVPGVDVVTWQRTPTHFGVRSMRGEAEVIVRPAGATPRYRYRTVLGDPLELEAVVAAMRVDGAMDVDGFADADAWLRYTARHRYPAAVVRIPHGHLEAARNRAQVLVSLDDRYRVGLGLVSVANRLRPLGGTHGALSATNALGVVMANFQDTPDALSTTVRAQFGGFDDLREPAITRAQVAVTTPARLLADRFDGPKWPETAWSHADSTPLFVVRLPDRQAPLTTDSLWLRVAVRPHGTDGSASTVLPTARWISRVDGRVLAIPIAEVGLNALTPGHVYSVEVFAELRRSTGDRDTTVRTQRLLKTTMRGGRDGLPWTF